jgi:hypothetical protein
LQKLVDLLRVDGDRLKQNERRIGKRSFFINGIIPSSAVATQETLGGNSVKKIAKLFTEAEVSAIS